VGLDHLVLAELAVLVLRFQLQDRLLHTAVVAVAHLQALLVAAVLEAEVLVQSETTMQPAELQTEVVAAAVLETLVTERMFWVVTAAPAS